MKELLDDIAVAKANSDELCHRQPHRQSGRDAPSPEHAPKSNKKPDSIAAKASEDAGGERGGEESDAARRPLPPTNGAGKSTALASHGEANAAHRGHADAESLKNATSRAAAGGESRGVVGGPFCIHGSAAARSGLCVVCFSPVRNSVANAFVDGAFARPTGTTLRRACF
ncbi:hypothetical protein ERJ75_000113300 [Trypanosoma vivax]|nr:hypothetical protein ERJ75_001065900 [Trypanosoma vivax]KAH8619956.1 hypothetical protein ERJ75_000113300 [Trypanosoma vivax]